MRILALIAANSAKFNEIYNLPFNKELASGHLSGRIFRDFLEQDRLYLRDYARAMNLFADRLPNETYARKYRYFAKDTVALEQEIQFKYLKKLAGCSFFGETSGEVTKSPVIAEYTEHLLDAATHAPIAVAASSFIPCFWIYNELGYQMNGGPEHPYQEWIATYSDEGFRVSTREMIRIADSLIDAELDQGERQEKEEKITACFLKSVEFEHQFFDEMFMCSPLKVNRALM